MVEWGQKDRPTTAKEIVDWGQTDRPTTAPAITATAELPTTKLPTAGFTGTLSEFGKAVVRGSLRTGKAVVGTAQTLSPLWGKIGVLPALGVEKPIKIAEEAKARITRAEEKFPVTHRGAAAWAGRVVGEAIPYMGAALAGGYMVGPIGAAMVGFSVEGDAAYDEAKARGASEEKAQAERVIVGSINAAIEAVQIGRLMKFHNTGKHSLKSFINSVKKKAWKAAGKELKNFTGDILKLSVEEGLEEFAQEGVSIIAPRFTEGPEALPRKPDGSIDWWAIGSRMGEAALGGAVAGGILGGAGATIKATMKTDTVTPDGTTIPHEWQEWQDIEEKPETAREQYFRLLEQRKPEIKLAKAEQKIAKRLALGKKFGKAEEKLIQGHGEKWRLWAAKAEMYGEIPKAMFTPIGPEITPDRQAELRMEIRNNPKLKTGEKINTEEALNKTFMGEVPQDAEQKLLRKQFGPQFATFFSKYNKDYYWLIMRALNTPRAMQASADVSFAGRQGFTWAFIHPKIWGKYAFWNGYKTLLGKNPEGYFQKLNKDIETLEYYDKGLEAGVDKVRVDEFAELTERAEAFMGDFAKKIPGWGEVIKRSELAYVASNNGIRWHLWNHFCEQWEGSGKSDKDYEDLAKVLNATTGRGNIEFLKQFIPAANVVFYSPRFVISRFQSLAYAVDPRMSWSARKILWGNLASFVGSGIAILGLLSLIPGIDVEPDPRSSDFGKIRIGNERIDFWAGYSPIVRLACQLLTGERKATDTKRIYNANAKELVKRFIRSKLAPVPGLIADASSGTTFIGKEFEMNTETMMNTIYENFVPFAAQDMIDAFQHQGLMGGLVGGTLAFQGIGVQTYPRTQSKNATLLKDHYSRQFFGQNWDEIGSDAQKAIRANCPQIEIAEAKARIERENYDIVAKIVEESQKAGQKVFKSLPKNVQSEMDLLSIKFPGLSRRIGSNWFLTKPRYKEYQKLVNQYTNKLLPFIIQHPEYQAMSVEDRRNILTDAINSCTKFARQQVVDKANRKDLESFMKVFKVGK